LDDSIDSATVFQRLSGVIETFNYQYAIKGNAGEAAPGHMVRKIFAYILGPGLG